MWTNTCGLRGKKLRSAITFTAVMGFLLFGYDQGLLAGLISGGEFVNEFTPLREPPDATNAESRHVSVLRGGVTASYEIGCFLGAIFTLIYGERFGRTRICELDRFPRTPTVWGTNTDTEDCQVFGAASS